MKKVTFLLSLLLPFFSFAAVKISDNGGNISAGNDRIAMSLLKKRNHVFNLSGKDQNNKNFTVVIESLIWYHGRSGNIRHIYQDQSEANWLPGKYQVSGNLIRSTTGNVDFEVVREIEFYDDCDAVRFEYILSAKESRDYGKMRFPLTRLTKEITKVSYDDGTLQNFSTSENPAAGELANTRAMIFHIPARNKSLLMLIDQNFPLKYGHKLGLMPTYSPGSWCRSVNFHHLYMPDFPFYNAGDKLGVRLYFQLLDGGELCGEHVQAVNALAKRMNIAEVAYNSSLLDDEYRKPSPLAAVIRDGGNGIGLWSELPVKRVYPAMEMPQKHADGLTLHAAANERESIQLVIRPSASSGDKYLEKVVFSDLVSGNGKVIKAENCYANILGIQKTNAPLALFYGETRFPDKLRPVPESLPAKVRAGQNSILHLTVFVPPATAAGVYNGKISLTVSGQRADIPVSVKVWNFELPAVSKFTAHGLLWSSLPEHREMVLKRLAEYGMNGTVYPGGQKQLREIFDGKELRFKDDLALAEKALKEFNQPMFQAPYLFLGAWNWAPGKKVQFLNLDLETREFDEKFTGYLSSLYRQVKAKGILDRTFIYMWDEMTGGHYNAMEKTVNMVHKHAPGIRLMTVSAPDPMVLKYNDIITTGPFGQWLGKDTRQVVEKALADGKEFWIYLNGITFSHQVAASIPRLTPWLCYAHGYTGYLQWSMDYNWQYGTFEKNGDVWILYPAYDKPVYAVRLEYFRDGVEDFNMFRLAEEVLPPEVMAEVKKDIAKIVPVMGKINTDPVKMWEIRNRIGELIDKYSN